MSLAPDILENDGIYSAYFYDFTSPGFYSVIYSMAPDTSRPPDNFLTSVRTSVSSSFYVSTPAVVDREDTIPPGRITDLKIADIDEERGRVRLSFTEPGDDYFDHGGIKQQRISRIVIFVATFIPRTTTVLLVLW